MAQANNSVLPVCRFGPGQELRKKGPLPKRKGTTNKVVEWKGASPARRKGTDWQPRTLVELIECLFGCPLGQKLT
jgi:hypothetical protein